MKERPILFSTEMVHAILAGRKTQTRRIIKPQPSNVQDLNSNTLGEFINQDEEVIRCPLGLSAGYGITAEEQSGDRLWVRETFAITDSQDDRPVVVYRAGGCLEFNNKRLIRRSSFDETPHVDRWTPSIHMPRWASRITLQITAVRVARLQDITEADAIAEGVYSDTKEAGPIGTYKQLWMSIYGPESWQSNPWVWAIEFKLVEAKCG